MPKGTFILMAAIALIGSNGLILSPVLSDIAGEFDAPVATIARAITGFGIATAVSALWLGRSLDGFGTRRALRLAMALGGVGQIAAGLSTGWLMLSGAEVLVGLSSGVALPAIYALTAEISPKGREAKVLGAVLFGWSISLIAAIPLGALLAELIGWRMMLMAMGGAGFALLPLIQGFQKHQPATGDGRRMGRFQPLFLPGGWRAYLICGFFMVSFYGTYTYAAAHVIRDFGVSTGGAGLVALAYGTGFGALSFLAGQIDRIGRARARHIGFPLAALFLTGIGFAPNFPVFLLAVFLWGMVNNMLLNTIVNGLTSLAPDAKGAVLGLYSAVTYVSAATGSFLMGLIFQNVGFIGIGLTAAGLHILAILLLRLDHVAFSQKRRW